MIKEVKQIILKFNDGSYKGYNKNAFISRFKAELEERTRK